jgi:cytochrome c biogenesis protein CcdA
MMESVLPALLSLAVIDSINPASITGALYRGGSGRNARLGLFILAVYSTYLLFGLALTLGPAAAVRSALADTPIMVGPVLDVVVGAALVGTGVRSWRRRVTRRAPAAAARTFGAGSALSVGVLTTLADLPTAGPLLVASTLIAASNARPTVQASDLLLYNVIYIAPLLAVAVVHRRIDGAGEPRVGVSRAVFAWAPVVLAGLCVAGGTVIGLHGAASLI